MKDYNGIHDPSKLREKITKFKKENGDNVRELIFALKGVCSDSTIYHILAGDPVTDRTARILCQSMGVNFSEILKDVEAPKRPEPKFEAYPSIVREEFQVKIPAPKAPPVTKTVVRTEDKRAKWTVGISIKEESTPPVLVLCLNKNGAVYAYAKSEIRGDDDLAFVKSFSYGAHLLYKIVEQKML